MNPPISQEIPNPEQKKPGTKKSKRAKADKPLNYNNTPRTRRRHQSDSDSQHFLPASIPKSSDKGLVLSQGFQNELSKIVIRVPFAMLQLEKAEQNIIINVEKNQIILHVEKNQTTVSLYCQLFSGKEDQFIQKEQKNLEQEKKVEINIWGKFVYIGKGKIQNKSLKKMKKQFKNTEKTELLSIKLKEFSSDLFFYLSMRAEQYFSDEYNGLINQGNTCYMNSYLQTLYHIPAFRNLVYQAQAQDESKFPATLQELFFNLSLSQKAISPQSLVKSFGWGKKQTAVQQDAQQFSYLFFEFLQKKLQASRPQGGYKNMTIDTLFRGRLDNYIRCIQVSIEIKL